MTVEGVFFFFFSSCPGPLRCDRILSLWFSYGMVFPVPAHICKGARGGGGVAANATHAADHITITINIPQAVNINSSTTKEKFN